MTGTFAEIDIVVIGVNCAATLGACLDSVAAAASSGLRLYPYYVDGGSTDASLTVAASHPEVTVLVKTADSPTPGIQRNAGFAAGTSPYVLFLDSDTVLDPHFLPAALAAMAPNVGAVCGQRNEVRPEATVYNAIAAIEWNAPAGDCEAFGGDVLTRREAVAQAGGYDEVLVGGEDPELSRRIRNLGWRIVSLDVPMTVHDIAMTRLSQYVRRAYRTGYGYAAVTARHGLSSGFWAKEIRRICIRGGLGGVAVLLGVVGLAGAFPWPVGALMVCLGLFLILYPRLLRVDAMGRDLGLSRDAARRYAWHCSLVVLPQLAGVLRYVWGAVSGRPLRNRRRALATAVTAALLAACLLGQFGCSPYPKPSDPEHVRQAGFALEPPKNGDLFASPAAVEKFSDEVPEAYLLGPGDLLRLSVWNRKDVSRDGIVVSPDGSITVERIGKINVGGRTVEDVTKEISSKLSHFYERPEVTLSIEKYNNNKAFVLGRVTNPGVVHFPGKGTLLEALALAGGLPVVQKDAFLTKCSIIRGKDTIIWIDLRELLGNGNVALNARLKNNDVVFIPESEDELVYVMGEVKTPGAIRLKAKLTFMDALMLSGGPTKEAGLADSYLIRFENGKGTVVRVDLAAMLRNADLSKNYMLHDNDILYIAPSGLTNFQYVMQQLIPALQVLQMGTSVIDMGTSIHNRIWDNSSSSSSDLGSVSSLVTGQTATSGSAATVTK